MSEPAGSADREREEVRHSEPPPWDWSAFSERRTGTANSTTWPNVDRLQQAYPEGELPACRPCHEALRKELAFFW